MATKPTSNYKNVVCFTYLIYKYKFFNEEKAMLHCQDNGENGGKDILLSSLLSRSLSLSYICPLCLWFHCGSHMASNSLLSSHWELSIVEYCQSPSWFNDMEKNAVQCSPSTETHCVLDYDRGASKQCWELNHQCLKYRSQHVPTPAAFSLCVWHINESWTWGPTFKLVQKELPKDKQKKVLFVLFPSNLA